MPAQSAYDHPAGPTNTFPGSCFADFRAGPTDASSSTAPQAAGDSPGWKSHADGGSAAYDGFPYAVNKSSGKQWNPDADVSAVASSCRSCYSRDARWAHVFTFGGILFHTPASKGALMKLSLSYKNVDLREPIETEVARHLGKLKKLLKTYTPDLVQVHASVEKHARKIAFDFSLNLALPTGNLHASGDGPDVRQSIKNAFTDLSSQLKKHQAKVRRDYQWKRKRAVPALVER